MATTYSDDPFKALTRHYDREVVAKGAGPSIFVLPPEWKPEELRDSGPPTWETIVAVCAAAGITAEMLAKLAKRRREPTALVWHGEKLAMLKFDYENSREKVSALYHKHGVSCGTLGRLIKRHGWRQRRPRKA